MLVQSGSGTVYAVLANSDTHEVSIAPTLRLSSTTVLMSARCRFKALTSDYFDPMMVPKQVLVGGIDRSENTLRGTMWMNTGFTVDKIGKGFMEIVAKKFYEASVGLILPAVVDGTSDEECALYSIHRRDDFVEHFGQLLEQAVSPWYPAMNYSHIKDLMNPLEFGMLMKKADEAKASFGSIEGGKNEGVDNDPAPENMMGAKVTQLTPLKPKTTPEGSTQH